MADEMNLRQGADNLILIDSHVHIHPCFKVDQFLDLAWDNFHKYSNEYSPKSKFSGVLILTETKDRNYFSYLAQQQARKHHGLPRLTNWHIQPTQESFSLTASNQQGKQLHLIAGQQVVTAEHLEVLSLIADRRVPNGLTLEATIQSIQAVGGLVVLPWGVGKWLGKRGQLIANLLKTEYPSPLFLGDNSGRPQFWSRPDYFQRAETKGWRILPGSDPLPLVSEVSRPGSFGLFIPGSIDLSKPGKQLKSMLLDPKVEGYAYGVLEKPWQFIHNQVALRLTRKQVPVSMDGTDIEQAIPNKVGFPEIADIETSSEDYATRFAGKVGAWLLQVQQAATLQMIAPYPHAKVLDVGGGHGQLTGALIEGGYQVTVLGSAEVCKQRIQHYLDLKQCSFKVGNVLDLPYENNAFDIVISYRFLAHVTNWKKFLQELARVASKVVIVDYPTVRSVNAIAPYLFKLKKGIEGNTRPFKCYQEKEIIDFYQSLGWQKDKRYAQFLWPMVLHRKLKMPKLSSKLETLSRFSGLTHLLGSPVITKFRKL